MLSKASFNESRSTDTVVHEPLDMTVTLTADTDNRQASVVVAPLPSTAADTLDQSSLAGHVTNCCQQQEQTQKSHAVIHDQQASTSSSLTSRCKRADSHPHSRQTSSGGRQKIPSNTGRAVSACRLLRPAARAVTPYSHPGNLATTLSTVDTKAKLRALILSGSRQHQPQHGISVHYLHHGFRCVFTVVVSEDVT